MLAILLVWVLTIRGHKVVQKHDMPLLGVCASVDKAPLLKKYGYAFIQPTVSAVLQPSQPDSLFRMRQELNKLEVPVEACNVFLPGSVKTTGPQADETTILNYAAKVFHRARELQVPLIVFGSGASRQIPEGFSKDTARKQFIAIGKKLAALAATYNIILALESQNRQECNFINTLKESVEIAREINHPHFLVTVDIYHMMRENEPAAHITEAGKYIYHCDIGEKAARTPPGVAGDDFVPYFRALQSIGYKGKIALECNFKNWAEELPLAMHTIQKQWQLAAEKK